MPVKDGLATIDDLKRSGLETRVLVLTSFPDDEMVISAIQLGANGILLKDSPPERLLGAIREVASGNPSLHPMIAEILMKKVQLSAESEPVETTLTAREIDILKCLAQGLSNREIAHKLSISTRTVTTHVRHILDKLGLDNRTKAALYAVEHGIVKK